MLSGGFGPHSSQSPPANQMTYTAHVRLVSHSTGRPSPPCSRWALLQWCKLHTSQLSWLHWAGVGSQLLSLLSPCPCWALVPAECVAVAVWVLGERGLGAAGWAGMVPPWMVPLCACLQQDAIRVCSAGSSRHWGRCSTPMGSHTCLPHRNSPVQTLRKDLLFFPSLNAHSPHPQRLAEQRSKCNLKQGHQLLNVMYCSLINFPR